MNILKINNSNILINRNVCWTNEYYLFVLSILKYIVINNNLSVNIILGKNKHIFFNNNKKTIKIGINYEHTLVKEGGRNCKKDPLGKIKYGVNNYYLVRICDYLYLNSNDIIIDYSCPNIFNVNESNLFHDFSKKHIYLSACLYNDLNINTNNRKIELLTTFISLKQERRKRLVHQLKISNLNHININNCFNKNDLQQLYQNTKILINIHQTPHHDTFEELRCLPALQNGVIIISEKVPLTHLIPYHQLIIWSDYDNIVNKTIEILDNYQEYVNTIFTEKNINLLKDIDKANKIILEKKILDIINN